MGAMHNPPHPGAVLSDTVLRPNGGITLTAFAERLRVSRVALSRVVHGHAAISAELAIRLAAALGGSAESWLRMQLTYDLWHAAKKKRPKPRALRYRWQHSIQVNQGGPLERRRTVKAPSQTICTGVAGRGIHIHRVKQSEPNCQLCTGKASQSRRLFVFVGGEGEIAAAHPGRIPPGRRCASSKIAPGDFVELR
jgi:addiction module HigA family antidote